MEIIVAIIAGIFGAFGKGFWDYLRGKSKDQIEEKRLEIETEEQIRAAADRIRKELHSEVIELRNRVDKLQKEVDIWREKYFKIFTQYGFLEAQYKKIELEYQRLQKDYQNLKQEFKKLKENSDGSRRQ